MLSFSILVIASLITVNVLPHFFFQSNSQLPLKINQLFDVLFPSLCLVEMSIDLILILHSSPLDVCFQQFFIASLALVVRHVIK